MRRTRKRPTPLRTKGESDRSYHVATWFCVALLVGALTFPMRRPTVSRHRTTTQVVLRRPVVRLSAIGPSVLSSRQGTRKVVFPDWFDYVVPQQIVWIESGIRTSRPCVESRSRAVQVVAVQRRIEWSEQFSIAEWETLAASSKQRLVLILRIQPSIRYEHLNFERIFVTWQLTSAEHGQRAFYSWIPEQEVDADALHRAVDRQWLRLSPNDPDPQLIVTWQIRPRSARRRF